MRITHEWDFGDDTDQANTLKNLVLTGKKRATTGLYCKYMQPPRAGEYGAIVGPDKKRFCTIRYTNVEVKPFLEVEFDFIQKEGEGDVDIEEWRNKHRKFFNLHDDNVLVICEEFEIVEHNKSHQ